MFIAKDIIGFCSQEVGDGELTLQPSVCANGSIGVRSLSFFITKLYDQCNVSVTLPPRGFVITAGVYDSPVHRPILYHFPNAVSRPLHHWQLSLHHSPCATVALCLLPAYGDRCCAIPGVI